MAEFYPLLFGRGFSLPQLLFFLLLLLTLVQGPSTGPAGQATLRIALGAACGRPPPRLRRGPCGPPCPCTLLPVFSPLRVLLPSTAR